MTTVPTKSGYQSFDLASFPHSASYNNVAPAGGLAIIRCSHEGALTAVINSVTVNGNAATIGVEARLTAAPATAAGNSYLWYYPNCPTGTLTIEPTGVGLTTENVCLSIEIVDGAAVSPIDSTNSATYPSGGTTTVGGTITTTEDNCLIMDLAVWNNGTWTGTATGSGHTTETQVDTGGSDHRHVPGYVNGGAAGVYNVGWTSSNTIGRGTWSVIAIAPEPDAVIDDISITSGPTANRVYRSRAASAVTIAGLYTEVTPSTLDNIQYRIMQGATEIITWTALNSPTIGSGAWSGTMYTPSIYGYDYSVEVRGRTSGGTVLWGPVTGSSLWHVGLLVGFIGSSTLSDTYYNNASDQASLSIPANDAAKNRGNGAGGGWSDATGSGCLGFANELIPLTDEPIGMILMAAGGSVTTQWDQTSDTNVVNAFDACDAVGIDALVLHISGDANFGAGNPYASRTDAYTRFSTIIGLFRTRYDSDLPVFIFGGRADGGSDGLGGGVDATWGLYQRPAELLLAQDPNTYLACISVDLPRFTSGGRNGHLDATGNFISGKRMARSFAKNFYNIDVDYRGPTMVESGVGAPSYLGSGVFRVKFEIHNPGATGIVFGDYNDVTGLLTGGTGFKITAPDGVTLRTITSTVITDSANGIIDITTSDGVSGDLISYCNVGVPDMSMAVRDNGDQP